MRKVNDMFHIENEQLVKTSNNQPIPDDEPVFIIRGRDKLALGIIGYYLGLSESLGSPKQRIEELNNVLVKFQNYANINTEKMKVPGITLGK